MDSNIVSDHIGHNDGISEMSFNWSWLITGLCVLFCLFAFQVESIVSMLDFSGETTSLASSEKFDNLFLGKLVQLLRSVSSEAVLLKTLLFLLDG